MAGPFVGPIAEDMGIMRTSRNEHTDIIALRPNGLEVARLSVAYGTRAEVSMAAATLRGRIRAEHGFTPSFRVVEYNYGRASERDVTTLWTSIL